MSRHNPDPNRLISWRGWFRFYWTAWRRGWEERETHPSRWCPYPCPCPFSRLKPIPKTYTFYYLPRFFNHALSDRWRAERRVWMTGSGAEPECHLTAGVIYDWRLDWQSRKSHNTWSVDRWSISQSEGSGGRGEKRQLEGERWEKERRLQPEVKKETAVWEILFFSILAHVPYCSNILTICCCPFASVELEYTKVILQSSRSSF